MEKKELTIIAAVSLNNVIISLNNDVISLQINR